MTEIHREEHVARHDVSRIGLHFDQSNGAHGGRRVLQGDALDPSMSRAAPTRASRRMGIGVEPVCASRPVTETSTSACPGRLGRLR